MRDRAATSFTAPDLPHRIDAECRPEMGRWCKKHCTGRYVGSHDGGYFTSCTWHMTDHWYFERLDDATLFEVRWG